MLTGSGWVAARLGGSEQDIVRNAIPPRRPDDVITAHLHLRLNKHHNNCLRYVRNHLRSGNGSWPQGLTHNPLTAKATGRAGRDDVKGGKGGLLTLFALLAAFVAVQAVQLRGVQHLAWRTGQTSTEQCVNPLTLLTGLLGRETHA